MRVASWIRVCSPSKGYSGVGTSPVALLLAASAVPLYGCQSSSRQLVGPSATKCQISIPSSLPSVGADGGNGTLAISAARECAWSVSSAATWLTITSDHTGQGSGEVKYAAAVNPIPAPRRGAFTVGELQVEVLQEAAACHFAFVPTELRVDAGGGDSLITLNVISGCAWTAVSDTSWIAIAGTAEGSGPGSVRVQVEANPGAERTGRIRIAGQTYTIAQHRAAPTACSATVAATTDNVAAAENRVTISVSAPSACPWTATSQVPWIQISRGAEGTGAGTVDLVIAANPGAERAGIVRVAGQMVTITQRATPSTPACSYALEPMAHAVASAGGTLTINVSTTSGCAWTAVSSASWITIASGAQSTGVGAVVMNAAANTGGQRSGVVSIAGQTVVITQSAGSSPQQPCSYSLGSTSQSVPGTGGMLTVTVSAGTGCGWASSSSESWITVTAGAQGTGAGTVTLAVASHTGPQRTGIVTIAGQTFTVTQSAGTSTPPCSYSLTSTTQSVPASGGALTVTVSTSNGCAWTAASPVEWISVANGAQGSGSGTVTLHVAVNTGPQRSGTVSIAGQPFTVTQAAAPSMPGPCVYGLSSSAGAVGANGGQLTVAVLTAPGCPWTATSQVGWLSVPTGADSGPGAVSISASANTGGQRAGTVAIAGQTFTVTQAAARSTDCTFSINPTEQAASALGGTYSVTVTTEPGCTWSATSNVPWIEINGNRSGTGGGTLTYKVSVGTVIFSREGTLTIAGQTLTVNQAGLLITGDH